MSRKIARETAFKLIYEYCVAGKRNDLTLNSLIKSDDLTLEDIKYIESVYGGIIENYTAITEIIEKNTEGYRLERIYKTDFAILALSIYEMKYLKGISDAVSVNEAVELAKLYSTDKSYSFINGVLAKIINAE